MKLRYLLILCATLLLTPGVASATGGDNGATLFSDKCASCHSIGKGNLVGPDLAKVAGWPEADLTRSVSGMQKMVGPLSDNQIKSLVQFLKSDAPATQLEKKAEEKQAAVAAEQEKNPASAETGYALFSGKQSFQNGGMSCIACHSNGQGGANLAPDLTGISQRMGETALISACENTSFKVMKAAYATHPITHDEARHLTKYLSLTKTDQKQTRAGNIWLAGMGLSLVTLVSIGFGYRNRNDSARKKLRRRQ